jgi:hypothetical protein
LDAFNEWKNVEYVEYFSQIGYIINHIHIVDLFAHEKQGEINKNQVYPGEILREIYETKLSLQFKYRKFSVTFNGYKNVEDLIDYGLSFHQYITETRTIKDGS